MSSFYKFVKENLLLATIEMAGENKNCFLDLSNSEIKEVPLLLFQLKDLTKLYLNNNLVNNFPSEISNLKNLKVLTLDYNQLTRVPSNIGQLSNLVCLNLSHNSLTYLIPEIGQLTRLEVLWLNSTRLEFLPPEIGNCTFLDTLGARGNFLKELPPEIGKLRRLRWLTLEGNLLSNLPEEIAELRSLVHLNLSNNQFKIIPKIDELKGLKFIFLSKNFITEINEESIRKMDFVKKIDLTENPITDSKCHLIKNIITDTRFQSGVASEDSEDSDSDDWEESAPSSDLDLTESSVEEMPLDEILEAALPQVAKFTADLNFDLSGKNKRKLAMMANEKTT